MAMTASAKSTDAKPQNLPSSYRPRPQDRSLEIKTHDGKKIAI